jgi:hypothetical protein
MSAARRRGTREATIIGARTRMAKTFDCFSRSVGSVGAKSDTGTTFSKSALQQAYGLSKHMSKWESRLLD